MDRECRYAVAKTQRQEMYSTIIKRLELGRAVSSSVLQG